MAASVPVTEMPETVTVLPAAAVLFANVAEVKLMESTFPATRSSPIVTLADVVLSYVLSVAVAVRVSVRSVIFAVVVVDVFGV